MAKNNPTDNQEVTTPASSSLAPELKKKVEELQHENFPITVVDFNNFLNAKIPAEDQKIILLNISKAVKNNKNTNSLYLDNYPMLSPELQKYFIELLEQIPNFIYFESPCQELDIIGKQIAARNNLLSHYPNIDVANEDLNLWEEIIKIWFNTQSYGSNAEDLTLYKSISSQASNHTKIKINNCIAEAGNHFFEQVLIFLEKNIPHFELTNFPYRNFKINIKAFDKHTPAGAESAKELVTINPEQIQLLIKHAKALSLFKGIFIEGFNPIDNDAFAAIKELIFALKGSSLEFINISFNPESLLTKEQIKDIETLLKEHKITTHVNFKFNIDDDKDRIALENIISCNRRNANKQKRKLKTTNPLSTTKSTSATNESTKPKLENKPIKTRPSKLGKTAKPKVQIQQQQEQQQQQQQQQQPPQSENATGICGTIGKLGLIDRTNINSLDNFYLTLQLKNRPSLTELWNNWFGPYNLDFNVKHLTVEAAKILIQYQYHFNQGLNLDNLPRGFFLKATVDGEKVLCYDAFSFIENKNESPLTIVLKEKRPRKVCIGDQTQFGLPSQPYSDFLGMGHNSKNIAEKLESFYTLMRGDDKKLADKLINDYKDIFESFIPDDPKNPDNPDNINGLWAVLYDEGCEGVEVILKNLRVIKSMHNASYYKIFKASFLDTSINWLELLEIMEDGFLVNRIANWSPTQVEWWHSLSQQHMLYNEWADLKGLVTAFEDFCEKYTKITYESLPRHVIHTKNMKVGMDLLLASLNIVSDKKQLIEDMDKLPWDPNLYYYALRYEKFHRIVPRMDISDKAGEKTTQYSVEYEQLKKAAKDTTCTFEEIEKLLYRYLGKQAYIADEKQYAITMEDLFLELSQSGLNSGSISKLANKANKAERITKKLMVLLAFTTTHQRRDADIPPQLQCLKGYLEGLNILNEIILNQLLNWNDSEPKINLEDALVIAKTLNEYCQNTKGVESHTLSQLSNSLKDYVNNYKLVFVQALHARQETIHPIDFLNYFKFLKTSEQLLENDTLMQSKLSLIMAKVSVQDYDNEKGHYLIQSLLELKKSKGETAQFLVDILSSIDLNKSPENKSLPVNKLIDLVKSVQDLPAVNYSALKKHITEFFPEYVFDFAYVPVTTSGPIDFNKELRENADEICRILGNPPLNIQLSESQKNDMHQNPMACLEKIYNEEDILTKAAINLGFNRQSEKFLDLQLESQIQRLVLNAEEKAHIDKIIKEKLKPALDGNFIKKAGIIENYLNQTSRLITVLNLIKNRWSNDFLNLVRTLNQAKFIDKCGLDFLSTILEHINQVAETNPTSLPIGLISTIVNHDKIGQTIQYPTAVETICSIITRSDLKNDEKEKLLSIAIANGPQAQAIVHKLLELHKHSAGVLPNLLEIYQTQTDKTHQNTMAISQILLGLEPQLTNTFFKLAKNQAQHYEDLVELITKDQDKQTALLIINTHLIDPSKPYAEVTHFIENLSNMNVAELNDIADLCAGHPKPTMKQISELFGKNQAQIRSFIEEFTRNPYANINLDEQFDTSQLFYALAKILDLNRGQDKCLYYSQRETLLQWFSAVNAMGRTHPAFVRENGSNKYPSAKDLTPKEIQQLVEQLSQIVQDPEKSPEEKLSARLTFLAIARTAMYRSTGLFPNSTQMLVVLNAIMQGNANTLSEIATGQGKTLITALLASLQWLEGKSVDICTSNQVLASDAITQCAPFYAYLGIACGKAPINEKTSAETYYQCKKGETPKPRINYSDVAQLALFRSNNIIFGEHMDESISLILDEADFTLLDDPTDFRNAINLNSITPGNPYEWIYPLLNEFVNTELFNNQNASSDDDIINLRHYLNGMASTEKQKRILRTISTEQLDIWIESALTARDLKEGRPYERGQVRPVNDNADFVVRKTVDAEDNPISVIHLIVNGRESETSKYSHGVQQCLEKRIQKEKEKAGLDYPPFNIDPEVEAIVAVNSKNFIDYYRERGVVWGITGTLEKADLGEKYGFKLYHIPSHQMSQRVDRIRFASKTKTHRQAVLQEVIGNLRQNELWWWKRDGQPRPLVIRCKNIDEANEFYDVLKTKLAKKGSLNQLMLYTAADSRIYNNKTKVETTAEDIETEVKKKAQNASTPLTTLVETHMSHLGGVSGNILITTLLDRGTDFKPRYHVDGEKQDHKGGLKYIMTHIGNNFREVGQAIGRSGRQGHKGESVLVINQQDLLKASNPQMAIKKTREKQTAQAVRERLFRERHGDIRNILTCYFMHLKSAVPNDNTQNALLGVWQKYLTDIETLWTQLESREEQGGPNEGREAVDKKLEDCSEAFITKACQLWNNMLLPDVDGVIHNSGFAVEDGLNLQVEDIKNCLAAARLIPVVNPICPENNSYRHVDLNHSESKAYLDMNLLGHLGWLTPNDSRMQGFKNQTTLEQLNNCLGELKQSRKLSEKITHLTMTNQENLLDYTNWMLSLLLQEFHQASKDPNLAVYQNELRRTYQKIMKTVVWSENTELQNQAFTAHRTHYQSVAEKLNANDNRYLQFLNTAMIKLFGAEKVQEWKQNGTLKFNAQSNTQEFINLSLKSYQNSFFKHAKDRKTNLEKLNKAIDAIEKDGNDKTIKILEALNQARNEAFATDLTADAKAWVFKRNKTGSRYQSTLTEIRSRLIGNCDNITLDKIINLELQDLTNTLQTLEKRLDKEPKSQSISARIKACLGVLNDASKKYEEKYWAMLELKESFSHKEIAGISDKTAQHLITLANSKIQDFNLYLRQSKNLKTEVLTARANYHVLVKQALEVVSSNMTVDIEDQDYLHIGDEATAKIPSLKAKSHKFIQKVINNSDRIIASIRGEMMNLKSVTHVKVKHANLTPSKPDEFMFEVNLEIVCESNQMKEVSVKLVLDLKNMSIECKLPEEKAIKSNALAKTTHSKLKQPIKIIAHNDPAPAQDNHLEQDNKVEQTRKGDPRKGKGKVNTSEFKPDPPAGCENQIRR